MAVPGRIHEANILKDLKPPKVRKEVVNTLNKEEIHPLLNVVNPDTPVGSRHYAILITFLD
ncbi:MAG: hypothetical protein EPO21_17325 [Chloroflexota bacterium]|nr:MAG: hypothetical protein EPO21_17325 [Chloroflexota bacterium]